MPPDGLYRYDLVLIAIICHPIHSAIACYYTRNFYHNNNLTIHLQKMDCMLSRWWRDGYASITYFVKFDANIFDGEAALFLSMINTKCSFSLPDGPRLTLVSPLFIIRLDAT